MENTLPLKLLSKFIGNTVMLEDDPMCIDYRDVLCVPEGTKSADFGLFDRGRKAITAAIDYRASPHPTPSSSFGQYTVHNPELYDFCSKEYDYVFLGMLTAHYGHFLTASMARLWVTRMSHSDRTRYVILNKPSTERFFEVEFIAEIFGALGIEAKHVMSLNRPMRFHRITVPGVAFEEHNFSHSIFGRLCARIGDIMVPQRLPINDVPVFLSKRRLATGIGKVVNEDALVDRLERAGIEICCPETMNMPDKIAMFRSRRIVTGLAGSGMHSAVFSPNQKRMALAFTPTILSNQRLLDQVSGNTTITYVAESVPVPASQGWQRAFRLTDPIGSAESFLRLIDTKLLPDTKQTRKLEKSTKTIEDEIFTFNFVRENASSLIPFTGWYKMEGAHCWTAGIESSFVVAPLNFEGNTSLKLSLTIGASLNPPYLLSRPLVVIANDVEIASFAVDRLKSYTCSLPEECLNEGFLSLKFVHPLTASPKALGESEDAREMSIMFKNIKIIKTAS